MIGGEVGEVKVRGCARCMALFHSLRVVAFSLREETNHWTLE